MLGYEGDDSFTYIVSDGSDTAIGLVNVREQEAGSANPPVAVPNGLTVMPNGDYRVRFIGDPDTLHGIEYTIDLSASPVVWVDLGDVTSDSSGNIELLHSLPPEPVVYYRAVVR